jgi:hypothetical protein
MGHKKDEFMEELEKRKDEEQNEIEDVIPHNQDLTGLNTPLSIEDIDFRIQSINRGGYATITAYKDARVDMKRLDDVVGSMYWKRELLDNNTRCRVSIYNKDLKEWVAKEDVGTPSATEKEKGLASDSFKRACFNWGIGRELYDYPVIQIKLNKNPDASKARNGEWYMEGNFPKQGYGLKLKEWIWFSQFTNGKLTYLACKDQSGTKRFSFGQYIKSV